jgi:hypothetical protein
MNFIIAAIPVLLIIPAVYLLITRKAKGSSDEPRPGEREPSNPSGMEKPKKRESA